MHANLSDARLKNANLRGANLSWTNLTGAKVTGADLSDSEVIATVFANMDLRGVRGLCDLAYSGPSTIGIDTLYRSNGDIPSVFLEGCGVPESLITYAHSLFGQSIEFYSCFLSYSSGDQVFAERLYADLRAKNIRCWFAPEDLRTGDRFLDRIED